MKLLCAADLHLGRQPSRLPAELRGRADLTSATAWRRLVAAALDHEVHAVLLAGDVLDDEFDYFEAYGDLRRGVEELVAAGITVLAVAGNHDVEVLPRLAQAVPELVLLGRGGSWEAHTMSDGEVTANVVGWSFPTAVVAGSPLPSLAATLDELPPAVTLGLLHCDRDQSGSNYAPVTSAELAAAGVDVWLLGHVHRPDSERLAPQAAPTNYRGGYLGSTFTADPGEEGPRGAWLLELGGVQAGTGAGAEGAGTAEVTITAVPLSPLRFETLTVDVSELSSADAAAQLITSAISELSAAEDSGHHDAVAVGLRLRLVGRSAFRAALAARLRDEDPRELLLTTAGTTYFVHDLRFEVLPAIDIGAAARGSDPLALMARKLLILEGPPSAEQTRLIEQGRQELTRVAQGKYYRDLEAPQLDDETVRGRLRRAALQLIDLMADR